MQAGSGTEETGSSAWWVFTSASRSLPYLLKLDPNLSMALGCLRGGTLMGVGAAMVCGCNVGDFYSALSALFLGGLAMMVGFFVGAYVGLRYIYWELERPPSRASSGGRAKKRKDAFNWLSIESYIGVAVFMFAIFCA